jgi:hypothetical protein
MAFELHRDFANWLDGESVRVVSLIRDYTDTPRRTGNLPRKPNLPIAANIAPSDILGEVTSSQTDLIGTLVTRFYRNKDKWFSLTTEGMTAARKLAERIWGRAELRDLLSLQTIEELLFEWVGDVVRKKSPARFSDKIARTVALTVQELFVVIPIFELHIDEEFSFATATVIRLSAETLDAIIETGIINGNSDELLAKRTLLHRRWLGTAAMRFKLTAEPVRAQEIAMERAADYMALFQFYGAPTTILALSSHAAPIGMRPYRTLDCLSYAHGIFRHTRKVSEPTYQLQMTSTVRAEAERQGLLVLSNLVPHTLCEYEEALLRSLLIFGRACYQLESIDKLLQVMTAVEMFALRSDSEPIQAGVADRLAFAITRNPDDRQAIANNLRSTYSLRSARTHHGKSIADTETIEQFLQNAWAFFLSAIQNVGRYRTRTEFLDHLDRLKYGHA